MTMITILPSWKYSCLANCTHQVWTCITPHSWLHRRELSHSCEEVMSPHIWMLQELAFFPALPWSSWSEPQSSQGSVPNAWACKDLFFEKYLNVSSLLREFLVILHSISKLWSALCVGATENFCPDPGWCLVCCAEGWLHRLRLGPVFE